MPQSINVNRANVEDLERAFQVSRERAQKIIEERDKSGGFKSWEDMKSIPGISERMIQNLQEAGMTFGEGGEEEFASPEAGEEGEADIEVELEDKEEDTTERRTASSSGGPSRRGTSSAPASSGTSGGSAGRAGSRGGGRSSGGRGAEQ